MIQSGLPVLAQQLQRPQFEAFRQRLTINYQVIGLEPDEATDYFLTKFHSAGVEANLIHEEALKYIIKHARQCLRRLNLMITERLILGAQRKKRLIDNEVVYAANEEIALL